MAEDQVERLTPILRSAFMQADLARTVHVAYVKPGATKEQLLDPAYWKLVAPSMRMGDRVEVYCEAGSMYAQLYVAAVGINSAIVRLLEWYDLGAEGRPLSDEEQEYKVKWGNPHTKWRIIRLSDGQSIKDGFETELDAQRDLSDYLKALRK